MPDNEVKERHCSVPLTNRQFTPARERVRTFILVLAWGGGSNDKLVIRLSNN